MVQKFIFRHPRAYQRLLAACLCSLIVAGLTHQAAATPWSRSWVRPDMLLPGAAGAQAADAKIAALPGKDGSSSPSEQANNDTQLQQLARSMNAAKFGDAHWPALKALWTRESNWNPNARNPFSAACGIPQALPCSKMGNRTPEGQIDWGLSYIQGRYGNPTKAWQFWLTHGWY